MCLLIVFEDVFCFNDGDVLMEQTVYKYRNLLFNIIESEFWHFHVLNEKEK